MARQTMRLDGEWIVAADPDNVGREQEWYMEPPPDAARVRVPGALQEAFPGYHGVAWYWKQVEAPEMCHEGGRRILRFAAVDYLAEVWVNGAPIGGHEGGETPFALDVTEAVVAGPNLIAVRVLNPTNEPIDGIALAVTPHRNKSVPYRPGASYNCGGILGPVELVAVPSVRIEWIHAKPDAQTGMVEVAVGIVNAGPRAEGCGVEASIGVAPSGPVEAQATVSRMVAPGETTVRLGVAVDGHRLWELDDPQLYTLTVRAVADGAHVGSTGAAHGPSTDEMAVRFGFRDFRVVDGYFELNGRRVFLKSTHTGNHSPVGQILPPAEAPDLLRRDLVYAKAGGYNMVRFIAGMAHPYQLDLCDELGLMVYEECYAGWLLGDSPEMKERFDRSVSEMILRDRNHASVVVWGLMNETEDGPVFQHAAQSLGMVRNLDDQRLVLLNSGRWDNQMHIGSVSNPGAREWEHVWGCEADEPRVPDHPLFGGYYRGAGDAHVYPDVPQRPEADGLLRTLGHDGKPVFLSEYGIGSLFNAIRELRQYQQRGLRPDLEDAALARNMAERFVADWERLGLGDTYAFPEDMLLDSQRLHCRQREMAFDHVRSNPRLAGYNLTGMLDHAMTGEGLWTFWREWKPGAMEVLQDGWAPLRWCVFVRPTHGYVDRPFAVEVVLASEGVLAPGEYPVKLRAFGPAGVAWEQKAKATVKDDGAFAVAVWQGDVTLEGPPGEYVLAASMDGAAPTAGRVRFWASGDVESLDVGARVFTWGVDERVTEWLNARGVSLRPFAGSKAEPGIVMVGDPGASGDDAAWGDLLRRVEAGSVALLLAPSSFRKGDDPVGRLPLASRGTYYEFNDWLYHKECVAARHEILREQRAPGVMDWEYFGPVISHGLLDGQETPDETAVAAFAVGYPVDGGYASGVMLGSWNVGEGAVLANTLNVLPNVGNHPAADGLLAGILRWAARRVVTC